MVYRMLREEGWFFGSSTGLNLAAAVDVARDLGPGHTVVTVLCDGGGKYQSRLFNRGVARRARSEPGPLAPSGARSAPCYDPGHARSVWMVTPGSCHGRGSPRPHAGHFCRCCRARPSLAHADGRAVWLLELDGADRSRDRRLFRVESAESAQRADAALFVHATRHAGRPRSFDARHDQSDPRVEGPGRDIRRAERRHAPRAPART